MDDAVWHRRCLVYVAAGAVMSWWLRDAPPEHGLSSHSSVHRPPFPSNRHHRSSGDCLEGKRKNYQVCSVQYCATVVHSELHTPMNRPNSSLDWVLSQWAHFTVLRSFLCMYYFVSDCTLHACVLCSIVTWWDGPGGIEAWSLGPLLPSVLWHCWLGHLTRKTRPRYDL